MQCFSFSSYETFSQEKTIPHFLLLSYFNSYFLVEKHIVQRETVTLYIDLRLTSLGQLSNTVVWPQQAANYCCWFSLKKNVSADRFYLNRKPTSFLEIWSVTSKVAKRSSLTCDNSEQVDIDSHHMVKELIIKVGEKH